jgi:hypothetical protein
MGQEPRRVPEKWRALPARAPREELTEAQSTDPPQDPERGRNRDTEWMLRWGGGAG